MIRNIINRINDELADTFNTVDDWFEVSNDLLNYHPKEGGWNIREILEHVSLTNHFLLILIQKGKKKALELGTTQDYAALLVNYDLDWESLKKIGEHRSFEWKRPEHMEPTGTADLKVVRNKLHEQMEECRTCLKQMNNGEGVLYKTMMSVNHLGKIDVYHYICFLAQHAKRHLTQMEKIKSEFENDLKEIKK